MDGKESDLNSGDIIPFSSRVYRIVLTSARDRKNKTIPAPRCFDLLDRDENRLSVDWEDKTTPEESIARIGASYKYGKTEFKPYTNRELYALEVDFLNRLQEVEKVVYDPIIQPVIKKGHPNNIAHSLVVFETGFYNDRAKRPETILKIRDHAKERKVHIDKRKLDALVVLLRKVQE